MSQGWRLGPIRLTSRRIFLLLLLLLILLRVAHSLTAVSSFDNEDGYTLAAAFELLGDNSWPYQAYQLSDWECGTLLVVLLAVPFCWLFGPCLFALKMTGLTISCVTFSGLYLLCKESFGARAALVACVIYIAFPNPVYGYSVTAHGFHPDSMALQLLFLWRLAVCLRRRPCSGRDFFILGALGGFAVYFAYISVFVVGAGVLPWLVNWARRRIPQSRFGLGSFIFGGFVGALPLWIYNVLNDFLGFNVYHGKLGVYVDPTGLADKLKFFQDHTARALLYFSNPFDPHATGYGIFEKSFWGVATVAMLMPLGYRLLARLRKRPVADSPWAGSYIDVVVPLFVIFTLVIFFNSQHPVGPAHIVPMLVLLMVTLAARLTLLWERGRLVGKLVAGLLLAGLLAAGIPAQLSEIKPSRLGSGLVIEGRNYPLFFFRALVTLQGREHRAREHSARHVLLALPAELSLDNKDYIHADHSPAFPGPPGTPVPDWAAYLRRYLEEPIRTDVKFDRAQSVGLALARLFQRRTPPAMQRHITMDQVMGFVAGHDEKRAGAMLELLGFNLGPRHDLLSPLRRALAGKPRLYQRLARRVAFGIGRATFLPAYLESRNSWCEHEKLPEKLQADYVRGLGHSLAVKMIRPVPPWAADNLCEARRPQFWQGVKLAPPPSVHKLAATQQITSR